MKALGILTLSLAITSCSSIPVPAGWESQQTKQTRQYDTLVEEVLKQPIPVATNPCAALQLPNKYQPETALVAYYVAMAGCLAQQSGKGVPDIRLSVIKELEHSRRESQRISRDIVKTWLDGITGIAGHALDYISDERDRESAEKIAKDRRSDNGESGMIIHGNYTTGSYNQQNSADSHTETTTTTKTTEDNDTTTSESTTTTTSTTTTEDNDVTTTEDNDVTTTEDNDVTTTEDNDVTTTEDNDVTTTTTTTTDTTTTTTDTDSRSNYENNYREQQVEEPVVEEPVVVAPDPVVGSQNPFESTCIGDFNTDSCWAQYYLYEHKLLNEAEICQSTTPSYVALCTKKRKRINQLKRDRRNA